MRCVPHDFFLRAVNIGNERILIEQLNRNHFRNVSAHTNIACIGEIAFWLFSPTFVLLLLVKVVCKSSDTHKTHKGDM